MSCGLRFRGNPYGYVCINCIVNCQDVISANGGKRWEGLQRERGILDVWGSIHSMWMRLGTFEPHLEQEQLELVASRKSWSSLGIWTRGERDSLYRTTIRRSEVFQLSFNNGFIWNSIWFHHVSSMFQSFISSCKLRGDGPSTMATFAFTGSASWVVPVISSISAVKHWNSNV